jgi:hypothetical protein
MAAPFPKGCLTMPGYWNAHSDRDWEDECGMHAPPLDEEDEMTRCYHCGSELPHLDALCLQCCPNGMPTLAEIDWPRSLSEEEMRQSGEPAPYGTLEWAREIVSTVPEEARQELHIVLARAQTKFAFGCLVADEPDLRTACLVLEEALNHARAAREAKP